LPAFSERLLHGRRGSTAVEFALIAFTFLGVLFGAMDLGRYYIVIHSLRTIAAEASRAALNTVATATYMSGCSNAWTAVGAITPLLDPTQLSLCIAWTNVSTAGVSSVTATATYSFKAISPLWSGLNHAITETSVIPF
jgi:Flp pilus assembly protein TadG